MKLLQELYGQGLLTEQRRNELQSHIQTSGKTEEEVILENKIVAESALFEMKSKVINIPLKKLDQKDIPMEVLEMMSGAAAMNYKMVPLFRKDNTVGIGMVYPEDITSQNALRFLSSKDNFNSEIYLITFTDLNNILKQYKTLEIETKKALEELGEDKKETLEVLGQDSLTSRINEDAPVIKMVLVILRHAIEGNASDIHIEPNREKLNIRFRQDGILHLSLFLPKSVHASIVSRVKILSNLKIDENRIPQDGRFSAKINDKDIDFRVATFPTLYGEKVEIRVLDPKEGLKSFDRMGFSKRNLEIIDKALKMPYGLILSSGPTGSGKTTTLYGLIRVLNKETVNIVTIEDPVEYSIDGVNQSQIRSEIGYSFAEGLRQILRQDPNVIMVGEIRDEETASLVTNAALTGHIVLSTLHTNSAVGVIPRLIDMGVRPFLIPSTLRVVISQRLIRTLCQKCRKKIAPSEKIRKYILDIFETLPDDVKKESAIKEPLSIYEAKGCQACNFKGYKGRAGLFEVLAMNEELIDIILKDPVESAILKAAQKAGMLTMSQEGILKVLEGETTVDEVARVTQEQ
ncbi:GspE/PulE family protein [Candidatus Parcubacteria bacterium]|nr:GspE/PulE family protein [Candidatus Parcubacteria bacterium]